MTTARQSTKTFRFQNHRLDSHSFPRLILLVQRLKNSKIELDKTTAKFWLITQILLTMRKGLLFTDTTKNSRCHQKWGNLCWAREWLQKDTPKCSNWSIFVTIRSASSLYKLMTNMSCTLTQRHAWLGMCQLQSNSRFWRRNAWWCSTTRTKQNSSSVNNSWLQLSWWLLRDLSQPKRPKKLRSTSLSLDLALKSTMQSLAPWMTASR